MSAPIKTYKKGKMSLSIWQGEYEGKETISFSIKKSYFDKSSNTWKDSIYYSITDLQDIQSLCNVVIMNNINKTADQKKPVVKQVQEVFNEDEKIPF